MNQQDAFASTQIIFFNPIMKESSGTKTQYFVYLRRLIRLVKWDKRKYTKAQIEFYKKKLCDKEGTIQYRNPSFDSCYCYLLPFDLSVMLAFHQKIVGTDKSEMIIRKIISDFSLPKETATILRNGFKASLGDVDAWSKLFRFKIFKQFKEYLNIVHRNALFLQKKPYNILITATMSAGKSTLINALVGKNISLMQNMACTSKIHTIVSKSFEDGISSEYDHDMSIDATKEELLTDNNDNNSSKITVGTYFNGLLGGHRIILFDSPGVNSNENIEHTEISQRMIQSQKYKLLVYVLNATQLSTTDEEQHLEIVAKHLGRTKILFVMNKIDHLISEDDNVHAIIERQRKFLTSKGFKNPVICPVSSRASFLAKKSRTEGLSRIEQRELENYVDKFERLSLCSYYEKKLKCRLKTTTNDEVQTLLINCGFEYFEKLILNTNKGGNTNGTSIC